MEYMSYDPSLCPSPGFVNDRPHFFINVFLKLKLSLFDLKCLMNSLSFSSLWSAPLAPLQQQHIFMSVKCDTHTHTRMSPVLHCSLSLSLSLVLSRPPSFLHFSSLSFLSSEPPWSTVNSVEFQSSQELTLLDEAD